MPDRFAYYSPLPQYDRDEDGIPCLERKDGDADCITPALAVRFFPSLQLQNSYSTFCLTIAAGSWYKNTKSVGRNHDPLLGVARWPEKPWHHENRKDLPGRSMAAPVVCRYLSPSKKISS